jgi:hypothetical protein
MLHFFLQPKMQHSEKKLKSQGRAEHGHNLLQPKV